MTELELELDERMELERDRYFWMRHQDCIYGRIANISTREDGISLEFFSTQESQRQRYRIKGNSDSLEDIEELKRGDQVGFAVEGNKIVNMAVINYSQERIPNKEEWNSPENNRERYKKRELDALINPEVMTRMKKRDEIVFNIRKYMHERGFMEVELPVLKEEPDIAPAPHFKIDNSKTHERLYLRTTFPPFERLFLSFDKAYSIGPNFRNGDESDSNLPEFNMFCMICEGRDYQDMQDFMIDMISSVAEEVNGTSATSFRGHQLDLGEWQEIRLGDYMQSHYGVTLDQLDSDRALMEFCERFDVEVPELDPRMEGHLLRATLFDEILDQKVVPRFMKPTFFTGIPWYLDAPSEPMPDDKGVKLRGEGCVASMELMNTENVLSDYEEIKDWYERVTNAKKDLGFGEYARLDKKYLQSVSNGLQPGGLASMGLDRLVMLITGEEDIKESVMYPLL